MEIKIRKVKNGYLWHTNEYLTNDPGNIGSCDEFVAESFEGLVQQLAEKFDEQDPMNDVAYIGQTFHGPVTATEVKFWQDSTGHIPINKDVSQAVGEIKKAESFIEKNPEASAEDYESKKRISDIIDRLKEREPELNTLQQSFQRNLCDLYDLSNDEVTATIVNERMQIPSGSLGYLTGELENKGYLKAGEASRRARGQG